MSFESSLSWVQPGVLCFGERPGLWRALHQDLAYLQQNSIGAILSLTEEESGYGTYVERGFHAEHIPLLDFRAPTMEQLNQCMKTLAKWEAENIPAYVHCYAGLGRSGTIAAAWLIRQGAKPLEAVLTIRKLRPGAIECEEQYNLLLGCSSSELF